MKRYRKVMGLAIVLVALAVAINALAFKTATITNTAKITVISTTGAAVAINVPTNPNTPGTGFSANVGSNYLDLNISDKMQPNSHYEFVNVLTLKNNTGRTVNVTSVTAKFKGGTHNDTTLDANGIHAKLALSSDHTQVLGTNISTVSSTEQIFDLIVDIDPGANTTDANEPFEIILVVGE